jgi:serine/threonine protein kinase
MARAHDLRIAHGALRPDCIFFDAVHRPKVCGFGVPHCELSREPTITRYLAPETSRLASAGLKGDVFSFSLIVYAVASEDSNATAAEAVERLSQGSLRSLPEFLAQLTVRGLSGNPGERPSMAQFLRQFEERNFAILAGADAAAVSAFAAWADETDPNAESSLAQQVFLNRDSPEL